jgi:hypothetical protein
MLWVIGLAKFKMFLCFYLHLKCISFKYKLYFIIVFFLVRVDDGAMFKELGQLI